MLKLFLRSLLAILVLCAIGFWQIFLSSRPTLTIDPATLAGDGSTIDYCDLPKLDQRGKRAAEIPKGNTPGCGYDHFPLPILAECTEPLPPEASDIRGLWIGVEGGHTGHVRAGRTMRAADRVHDFRHHP